jgi:hypothetical protein
MSFGEESTRTDQPNFPPQRFLTKAIERQECLGNTILVKLKLWELVIVFNKPFWSATNLCLRYGGIVFAI